MSTTNSTLSVAQAFSGWNNGVIYTSDNCSGCNKCLEGCPVIEANVVYTSKETGKTVINVDANRCITCGHCTHSCKQNARIYNDDIDSFFEDIKNGVPMSVIVDSSFEINYPDIYRNILGYLKHMGVHNIYSSAFGADIATWAYLNYLSEHTVEGAISPTCPSIITYIERYEPTLLPKLLPIHSPMMCSAIYIRNYLHNNDTLAYIGPCIAKKLEIEDPNNQGLVSYNVTFSNLMNRLAKKNYQDYIADYEPQEILLGGMYPMPGGLKRNMETYAGYNNLIIQFSGPDKVYPFIHEYTDIIKSNTNLPFMVELLNCSNGCNRGSATEHTNISTYTIETQMYKVKNESYRNVPALAGDSPAQRFTDLNRHFRNLRLNDFIRQFNYDAVVDELYMSEAVMDAIFISMNKFTLEDRTINCGACGYSSCEKMARAIGFEINRKENCIFYMQQKMNTENKQITALVNKISDMNKELQASAQLKSNFLANMSHEIRTPMNTVIGMAEMALRGPLGDREKEYITQIRSSGRSLLAIINDILDFSKIESGKLDLNETEFELMPLIHDVSAILVNRIQDKPIHLILDIKPSFPRKLIGDDVRIRQMIINLANNAVKFTNEGKVCLHFDYCECDGGIRFICAVEDTGIGIKPEDMNKLFISFQQVDNSRNRNIEGTGLGLAITRMLAELMDGTVNVTSQYGIGSVFTFDVKQGIADNAPSAVISRDSAISCAGYMDNGYTEDALNDILHQLDMFYTSCNNIDDIRKAISFGADTIFVSYGKYNDEIRELAISENAVSFYIITDSRREILEDDDDIIHELKLPLSCYNISAAINRTNMVDIYTATEAFEINFEAPDANILIVDDNVTNLTVAEGLLEPLKMNITTCSSPTESIELIKKFHYDLIFMDHMMPGMDGVETTHRIRALDGDYFKNVPIIALTANAISGVADIFLEEGMNDFVSKPIEMITITSTLKKWLPKEFIHELGNGEIFHANPDTEKAPVIKGLDTNIGVKYTGSVKLYMRVLKDYYRDIAETADLISFYEKGKDYDNYKILVHSLKSTSKTIGATELSELAASLESAAANNNTSFIHTHTEQLLTIYRNLETILEPYINDDSSMSDDNLSDIDNTKLIELLGHLINAMENLDFNTSTELIEEIGQYKYSERELELFHNIKDCVENLDSDSLENYAMEWMETRNG